MKGYSVFRNFRLYISLLHFDKGKMMKNSFKRKNVVRKEPIPAKLVGQAFIDPTYDTGFQELFDSPKALKDFLDGLLDLHGNDQIKELKYTFNYTSRFRVPQSRKIIMDAFATTGSGRFLDIEMQRAEHSFFTDRAVLYKAFLVLKGKQQMDAAAEFKALSKEEKEYRRYQLPECISIWICNFDLPELCGKYIDEWAIYSRNSLENGEKEPVFAKNKYIIISLANFNKSASEVKTATDAWLYLLKNAGTENEMPSFGNSAIEDALERIRIDNLDDETLKAMEREMVTKEEIECRLAGAKIETRKATQIDVAKILVEAGKLSIDDAIALLHVPETTARRWKKKKV